MVKRKAYTMNWTKLIQKFNENNLGQINQQRLSELFNQSKEVICLDQNIPRKLNNLEKKYMLIYKKHFELLIPFNEVIVEHEIEHKIK